MSTRTSRTVRVAAVGLAAALSVTVASCSDDDGDDTTTETTTPQTTQQSEAPQVGDGRELADEPYTELDDEALQVNGESLDIDSDDPESVLTGGLEASFAWEPAKDTTAFDALRRASSVWNNTWLADNEARLTTLVPMSSADWEAWGEQDQQFFPEVTVLPDDHPADTSTDFSRMVRIDMNTGTDDDPTSGRTVFSLIATARVHNTDVGWRIDTLDVIDNLEGQN